MPPRRRTSFVEVCNCWKCTRGGDFSWSTDIPTRIKSLNFVTGIVNHIHKNSPPRLRAKRRVRAKYEYLTLRSASRLRRRIVVIFPFSRTSHRARRHRHRHTVTPSGGSGSPCAGSLKYDSRELRCLYVFFFLLFRSRTPSLRCVARFIRTCM